MRVELRREADKVRAAAAAAAVDPKEENKEVRDGDGAGRKEEESVARVSQVIATVV